MMTYQRACNNPSSIYIILLLAIFPNAIESTEKILLNKEISFQCFIDINLLFGR